MKLRDYSPPTVPTVDDQRDALQKGLGRSMQWALAGRLSTDVLLDACLNDKRCDMQCEDNRGEWLWNLAAASGNTERIRLPILGALSSGDPGRNGYQLCELAFHFARSGDQEAEKVLYDFVSRRPVPDSPEIGEGQLLTLDAEKGLLFIARIRGQRLSNSPWEWDDDSVVDDASEILGEDTVRRLLLNSTDDDVRRFGMTWPTPNTNRAQCPRENYVARMKSISLAQVLAEAVSPQAGVGLFRGWGRYASEDDLLAVAQEIRLNHESDHLVNLLRVFSGRPIPAFEDRLFELFAHDDPNVRRWAIIALEQVAHPSIREFALKQLEAPPEDDSIIGLFVKHFVPGDEKKILESIEFPSDDWERHGWISDVLQLLEVNEEADRSELGLVAYFETPCEVCRRRAVELLVNSDAEPEWMLAECASDSSSECRKFIKQVTTGDCGDEQTDGMNAP